MSRRLVLLLNVLLLISPLVTQASQQTPAAPAYPLLSETERQSLRRQLLGGLDISLSGFTRIEATTERHFDLGAAPGADNTFYDIRGYIGSRIAKGATAVHIDVDFAGNDFSDPEGAVLGNGLDDTATPGGPAVVRNNGFNLQIRHLYLTYQGWLNVSAGRMPARIGHGIAINTIRDSAKAGKSFGALKVVGILVKGGETQPNSGDNKKLNTGSDNDLDAYGSVAVYHFNPQNQLQFAIMKQADSTFDDHFPEKLLLDLNGDLHAGSWSYAFETAWLSGHTPRDPVFSRRKNSAWMGYGRGQYHFDAPNTWLALSLGMGSGENQKSDKQRNFQSFFMNATGFHIANIYGNDIHSYDAFLPGSGKGRDGNNAGAGFANTSFIQISGHIPPFSLMPNSTIEGVFTYLRATRRQHIGEGVLLGTLDGFSAKPGETANSHDIGWEADINLDHPLTESMHSYLRTGWFVPGAIFGPARKTAFKVQGGVNFIF